MKIHYIINEGKNRFGIFGFIKEEKTEKEYYVHSSGIKDNISENDKVMFDLEEGKKGLNAVNVKLV